MDTVKEAIKIIEETADNKVFVIKSQTFEEYYDICRSLKSSDKFYVMCPHHEFSSFEELNYFTEDNFPYFLAAIKSKNAVLLYEQFIQISFTYDISKIKNEVVILNCNLYRFKRLPLNEKSIIKKVGKGLKDNETRSISLYYDFEIKETVWGEKMVVYYKDNGILEKVSFKEVNLIKQSESTPEIVEFDEGVLDFESQETVYVAQNMDIDVKCDNFFQSFDDREFVDHIRQENPSCVYILAEENYINRKHDYISVWQSCFKQTRFIIMKYELKEDEIDIPFMEYLKKYWKSHAFKEYEVYDLGHGNGATRKVSQERVLQQVVRQVYSAKAGKQWRDLFFVASTGAGKSLLYQLPSIIFNEDGYVVLVVSPLIALMKDQVEHLRGMGINFATYINSELSYQERVERLKGLREGKYSLVYVSPEFLQQYSHVSTLLGERELGLVVVDEAHCVSTWGKDFRVDYGYLGDYITGFRKQQNFPILALTATAVFSGPFDTVLEIMGLLNFKEDPVIYFSNVRRKNIEIDINTIKVHGDHRVEKENITLDVIRSITAENKKGIVYTLWKSHANRLYSLLDDDIKSKVGIYTGGTGREEGDRLKEEFKEGKLRVVIATKAFGMGIDIRDIDLVYHHTLTGNICDYVQEIGRAARDEKIQGIASSNHDSRDFKYYRILKSISRPTNYELSLVLAKLNEEFRNLPEPDKRNRQMLIPLETLSYAFKDADNIEIERKVRQALFLIEKDLNKRFNWDVLRVYPRDEYGTYYCTVEDREEKFRNEYGRYIRSVITKEENSRGDKRSTHSILDVGNILEIDIKALWEEKYADKNFRQVKNYFFNKKLFDKYLVMPRARVRMELYDDYETSLGNFADYIEIMKNVVYELKNKKCYLTKEEADDIIKICLKNDVDNSSQLARKINHIILDILTRDLNNLSNCSHKIIIEKRDQNSGEAMIAVGGVVVALDGLISIFRNRFKEGKGFERYIVPPYLENSIYTTETMDMAYILQILGLGSFSISGGAMPYVNILVNSPEKLYQPGYKNNLLSQMKKRDEEEFKLMNRLIYERENSSERWDLIEDYFLGRVDTE